MPSDSNFKSIGYRLKKVAKRWCLSAILLWLMILQQVFAAPLQWKLEGVSGDLKKNAGLYLDAMPDIEPSQLSGFKAQIIREVQYSLQALGYYDSIITVSAPISNSAFYTVHVVQGEPVIINELNILLLGDGKNDQVFSDFVGKLPLVKGAPFNHGHYKGVKNLFNSLAVTDGYFNAKLKEHRVSVYPDKHYADINLTLDSGPRYHFGNIQYENMQDPVIKLIKSLVTIHPGDPYDATKVGKLTQDISSTGFFSQIDVRPLIDIQPVTSPLFNDEVPVSIAVIPNLNHEFQVGVGYSTDEGPRFSMTWDKPWVNNYGHSLSSEALISENRTEITSGYKIPVGNPLQEYYNLQTGYQKKNIEDTESELYSVAIHRWNKRSIIKEDDWDQDIFFRVEHENFQQSKQNDNTLLLIPGISFSRRSVQGDTAHYQGNQELAKLELSSKAWGSDVDFIKIWGRTKWLRTFFDKHRVITRAAQGVVFLIDNVTEIPPSLRFFTGGDQTIRGFSYQSISPKDSSDNLLGAKYLTVTSVEYAYSFTPKWWLATFIDSGTATNNYNDKWKMGSGVGIRWSTPIGQLKVDVACAISEEDKPWRLHITIGPAL